MAQLFTPHGYEFFEVASALQKEIRRGNEENAMYWAVELSARYPQYTWHRLAVIAFEDIGPADNQMVLLIDALRRTAVEAMQKPGRHKVISAGVSNRLRRCGLRWTVPHDMRRSGVRNLRRAGNDEHDCMEISGHKTRAVFDRYDIIDEDDQRLALERQQEYKRQQMQTCPDPATP